MASQQKGLRTGYNGIINDFNVDKFIFAGGGGGGGGGGGVNVGVYVEGAGYSMNFVSYITSDHHISSSTIAVHLISILFPNSKAPNLVTI